MSQSKEPRLPLIRCPICNVGTTVKWFVSSTAKNPGRHFYRCEYHGVSFPVVCARFDSFFAPPWSSAVSWLRRRAAAASGSGRTTTPTISGSVGDTSPRCRCPPWPRRANPGDGWMCRSRAGRAAPAQRLTPLTFTHPAFAVANPKSISPWVVEVVVVVSFTERVESVISLSPTVM
jgi:hypothetical protein